MPINLYRTRDDNWLSISAASDALFRRLALAINRPEWVDSDAYAQNDARVAARSTVDAGIGEWVAARDASEGEALLRQADVPVARVNSTADLIADPHAIARGDFETMSDAVLGEFLVASPKPRLSETPGRIRRTAPGIGEHNTEILRDILGLATTEIDALRTEGAVPHPRAERRAT